ncbi:MAG TPA: hypothetical protein VLE97_07165 [Gaiellaceae bacterium]|nr:hypothetical protein [Gaiellaceae bacterium]
MARPQTHKDVEYMVDDASGRPRYFKSSNEAAGFAISIAMSRGQEVNIDVLVHSSAGARWYRGSSDGVDEYNEDPEASVFDRIVVRAESQGRIS